ncbi:alpha/beta fold hydrolase [Jannaschia sp. 2305UL9-9]|uniref:alpha/beta fold hydrolase n=1 Tax=Jannaschia sp. 2305UL9-9 TaxID=3121638 RepID=UPI003526D332
MTPLVLLPGMMCDARLFAPQIAAFGSRAVMVAPIDRHDTVTALADEVLRVAPARFALAGLSMGGIVAMEVIARAPDRIAGLCLMDTNASPESPAVAALREPHIAAVQDGDLRRVMRDEMKPTYLADGPHRGAILDTCMAMAETMGAEVFVRQSRALQTRPDQRDALRKVTVPTMVLCGAEDRLCPLHRHEVMRDLIPDASLCVIPDAGHLPTLEKPAETTAAMKDWMSSVEARECTTR